MFSIKVSAPHHLNRRLPGTVELYGFTCPSCKIYLSQLSNEVTPYKCRICHSEVPDVRGMINRPQCRIGYHIEKEHK